MRQPSLRAPLQATLWAAGLILLGGAACDTPDPAAEDPFQQLAQGPKGPGDKPADGDQPAAPADGPVGPANGGGESGGAAFTPDPREFVEVSGTLSITDWEQPVQIDFIETNNPGPEGRPRLTLVRLPKPGPFSVKVLKAAGPVEVNVYLDAKGDGPGDGDLMLQFDGSPIQVGEGPVEGLTINLQRNQPPSEDGAPGAGGAPPPGEGDGGKAGATGETGAAVPPPPGAGDGGQAGATGEAAPPPPGAGDGGQAGATGASAPAESSDEEAP